MTAVIEMEELMVSETEQRRAQLYSFLLSRGDKWTSFEQCTDSIAAYPTLYTGTYHNSTARRLLTKDIRAINESPEYPMIIVTGNFGLKLGTEAEVARLIKARMREARRMLFWVSKVAKKAARNGATDFDGETVEAFLEATEG